VVYPALAAVYVVFHKRPYLKRILPMFAVSLTSITTARTGKPKEDYGSGILMKFHCRHGRKFPLKTILTRD
jgi:hypothetical protein